MILLSELMECLINKILSIIAYYYDLLLMLSYKIIHFIPVDHIYAIIP